MLKLKRLTDTAVEPTYATEGSAAFDLTADLKLGSVDLYFKDGDSEIYHVWDCNTHVEPSVILPPGSRTIIPTGFAFLIDAGWYMQITPRSGNAAHSGVTITNSPAVIDSDYTGETFIIVQNTGHDDFLINHGDRIAQAMLKPVHRASCIEIRDVKRVTGDAGGLGSTGKGE